MTFGFLLLVFSIRKSSLCIFFFFKQKTAYEMRISDWSSDVCSSDLQVLYLEDMKTQWEGETEPAVATPDGVPADVPPPDGEGQVEIGRASCRERVCQYV